MIYAALPLGSAHGWGVCGKYLARGLSRLSPTRLITDPFTVETLGDDLEYRELLALVPSAEEGSAIDASPLPNVPGSVLQCITGKQLLPYKPGIRGAFNLGYAFFEDNLLPDESLDNARRAFERVATGSSWCTEVLRQRGLADVSTVIQGVDTGIFHPDPAPREYFRDRFVVFSGGKLEFRKGQDLVIRAYKVLQDRHPDVMLVTSWHNPWPATLATMRGSPYIRFSSIAQDGITLVSDLLVENGIDLSRAVVLYPRSNATMGRVYANTDVALFPNRCEGGTNLVLMEYMACGKPAVVSYSSGHRDV
ncbi:MAG: glycosyltransferase family 4 protein, partial [Chloroflexota bacterium]